MSKRIVKLLEVIQVEHYDAERLAISRGARDFALQCLLQISAIEQSGNRVADRLAAQCLTQPDVCDRQADLLGELIRHLTLWFRDRPVTRCLKMDHAQGIAMSLHRDAQITV